MEIKNKFFNPGKITWNTLKNINPEQKLSEQTHLLDEDLLQIIYPDNIVLDVGWYPSGDIKGKFHAVIVKESVWEKPIFSKKCGNIPDLLNVLNKLHHKIVKKLLESKGGDSSQ